MYVASQGHSVRKHAVFCIDAGIGGEADRRPPVWRAVVRPARYFCVQNFASGDGRAGVNWPGVAPSEASRWIVGTNESKSTGFGTCRSKPAWNADSTSAGDA